MRRLQVSRQLHEVTRPTNYSEADRMGLRLVRQASFGTACNASLMPLAKVGGQARNGALSQPRPHTLWQDLGATPPAMIRLNPEHVQVKRRVDVSPQQQPIIRMIIILPSIWVD